jgi:putative copper resistance protein D
MTVPLNTLQLAKIAAQAIFDLAFGTAAGAVLCQCWLDAATPQHPAQRQLHRLAAAAAALMLLTLPILLLLVTATMIGSTAWADLRPALHDVLTTEAGRALAHTFLTTAPLFLWLTLVRGRRSETVTLTLLVLIAMMRTPFGHAAVDGAYTLREAMQLLHLTAVAVWGGGVMVAGLMALPLLRNDGETVVLPFAHRLSHTVTIALAGVLISGTYNAWRGLDGKLTPLVHPGWGGLLLSKTLLVLLALALGARMRWMLRSASMPPIQQVQQLRRGLRIEALAMLLIFVLSAWLANTAPSDEMSLLPQAHFITQDHA